MKKTAFHRKGGMEREKILAIATILISLADLAVMDARHEHKHNPLPGKDYSRAERVAKTATTASLALALYNNCHSLQEHRFW